MILKGLSPEFLRSLTFEQRMALAGERSVNGRFIHKEGLVDIVCLTEHIDILSLEGVRVSVVFYSNNEPIICLDDIPKLTPSLMRKIKEGMELVKEKFYDMGYDKIFSLTKEGDIITNKLTKMIGFTPVVIYKDPVNVGWIKNEMDTRK